MIRYNYIRQRYHKTMFTSKLMQERGRSARAGLESQTKKKETPFVRPVKVRQFTYFERQQQSSSTSVREKRARGALSKKPSSLAHAQSRIYTTRARLCGWVDNAGSPSLTHDAAAAATPATAELSSSSSCSSPALSPAHARISLPLLC